MPSTIVDQLHSEFRDLTAILEVKAEVSLSRFVEDNFRKSLLLCAASAFERQLSQAVEEFAREASSDNQLITNLVRSKAIARQYHTWFNWDSRNANTFFSLFGDGFRRFMKEIIESDENVDDSIRAFMELGSERNRLLHQDYGSFALEKTTDEIYELYLSAQRFVELVPQVLRDCSRRLVQPEKSSPAE